MAALWMAIITMDDFLLRAGIAGIAVALMAGPLGCVLIWRRMVYFGAALSHASLLGVALGFWLGINVSLSILGLCLCLALLLSYLEKQNLLARDTLLGIFAHAALALGILIISLIEGLRLDLMAYLFGDILATDRVDVYLILGLLFIAAVVLKVIWRDLIALTVHEELARAEGINVDRISLAYVLLLASVIAIGMKTAGMLLIISLLIIPAASARKLASTPEHMSIYASLFGCLSVVVGLGASWTWDLATGPAIVIVATGLFILIGAICKMRVTKKQLEL